MKNHLLSKVATSFFFLSVFIGCSGMMVRKYGMDSMERFEVTNEGYYVIPASMSSSAPYSGVKFEGVTKLTGISVDRRIYSDSDYLAFSRDVETNFSQGTDSAIVFYRNYVTSCCHGFAVGSFIVFLGYDEGKLSPSKSFITEAGSIAPPHYTWWPRKIVVRDSLFYIEAYETPRDTIKPYWFEIYSKGITESSLDKFSKSKSELRKLINENAQLVTQK
jgi:hypothetical protein